MRACARSLVAARALLLCLWVAALCPNPSAAAEVQLAATPDCQLTLEGPIKAGDAEKLASAFEAIPQDNGGRTVTLCLSSPGGSYDEGLRMIRLLLQHGNVETIVDAGAQCYSACAFLFLAGNQPLSEDGELGPLRFLDVRGTLGFHAPYLKTDAAAASPEETAESFRQGVIAIAKMLEIDRRTLFPQGLLAKALQVGPDYLLFIDTVEKAGVWSIGLKGYKPPVALSDAMLDQACRNKDMWTSFSHTFLGRPANDPDESHGLRESDFPEIRGSHDPVHLKNGKYRAILDLFGHEATDLCIADVYSDAGNGLFLGLGLMPTEEKVPPADELLHKVKNGASGLVPFEVPGDPLWLVYPPETRLESLAMP